MWSYLHLRRIDLRIIPIILLLMIISLMIIASYSVDSPAEHLPEKFFTPVVQKQFQWFVLGWIVFFACAAFDYHKLRELTWLFYPLTLLALGGLFFTDAIQRVNRWYRIPGLNFGFQPSEAAKLVVVITLSWFLERRKLHVKEWGTVFWACVIVGIPFLLILKQPDLGTALVLFPISLVMFYFGHIHPWVIRFMTTVGAIFVIIIALIFLGVLNHEEIRPYATKVLKNYQFDRLNPNTHHQKAAATAIALGGVSGTGWRNSEYTAGGWLPTPYTDSVFPSFGEEFGFIGLVFMLGLYYALIYYSFQVTTLAKDQFGQLLSAGITTYLAMHVLINIGMMCGFFPITGVPLLLVSYGGTSLLATMAALGILQSIYSRRFMF